MEFSFNLITRTEDCDVIMAEALVKKTSVEFKVNTLARQVESVDRAVEKLISDLDRQNNLLSLYNSLSEGDIDPSQKKKYSKGGNQIDNDKLEAEKSLLAYPEERALFMEHKLAQAQLELVELDAMILGVANRKSELQSAAAA
jgi:hypothetical protein